MRATEKETVLGPGGRRYHRKCLVCGGCKRELDSEVRGGETGILRCEACRVSFFFSNHLGDSLPRLTYSIERTETRSENILSWYCSPVLGTPQLSLIVPRCLFLSVSIFFLFPCLLPMQHELLTQVQSEREGLDAVL